MRLPEISKLAHASADRAIALKQKGHDVTYLFAGDLADPHCVRSHAAVMLAAAIARKLNAAGVLSWWLTGNHDVVEDGSGDHVLMVLAEVEGAEVLDRPELVSIGNVNLLALPFTPTSHNYDPAQFVRDNAWMCAGAPTIVLGHLNLKGISAGSETKDMPRGRDVYWPLEAIAEEIPHAVLVGGHYHDPQVFQGVHIIGSLPRLSHGETADPPGYAQFEVGNA